LDAGHFIDIGSQQLAQELVLLSLQKTAELLLPVVFVDIPQHGDELFHMLSLLDGLYALNPGYQI
jgi:hypothetical protein